MLLYFNLKKKNFFWNAMFKLFKYLKKSFISEMSVIDTSMENIVHTIQVHMVLQYQAVYPNVKKMGENLPTTSRR